MQPSVSSIAKSSIPTAVDLACYTDMGGLILSSRQCVQKSKTRPPMLSCPPYALKPLPSRRKKSIVTSAEKSNQPMLWATRIDEDKV